MNTIDGRTFIFSCDPIKLDVPGSIPVSRATEDGSTIEVGMVGYEGFVGTALVLKMRRMPYRSMMQIAGQATKIKAPSVMDTFDKNLPLRNLVLRYLHVVLT